MLVLRRRAGEALLIGNDVEIEFLEISAHTVKIGIKAPKEVCVLRKELHITRAQNQAAARTVALSSLKNSFTKIDG
ncbi:MAG: carbon storage regulator [Bryobacteraceae bacterium]